MKRLFALIMSLILIFTLAACGGSPKPADDPIDEPDPNFQWTREGFWEDGNGNYVSITHNDEEGLPEWYVTFSLGDDMYGSFLDQEGETLHGDIGYFAEMKVDEFIVTISEEDEDGLLLETESGEAYHFTLIVLDD
ncbi:MAG: hypothetical protein IKX81_01240 [Firmicutes bacterium]|nr:hypothetical protein [Bacillota bacterium]